MWNGDYVFLLQNLISKDFKIRYRNMSLGVFWSLLNPLIMMAVLSYVFTVVLPSSIPNYPLFVLCGLVPFNFFTVAWQNGTICVANNSGLIKRIPVPRELVPISTVLSTCIHLLIQLALLLSLILFFGRGMNIYWFWLPAVWLFTILFVCGITLLTSALDVYIRDMRYVVESANTLLFWMVPVVYSSDIVPQRFANLYQYNPLAALILAMRRILLDGTSPTQVLMTKLALSSTAVFLIGLLIFNRLKSRFFDFL